MDRGRIVAEGAPHVLIKEYATREVLEMRFEPGTQLESVERLSAIGERVEILPDRLLCYADDGEAALVAAMQAGLRPVTSLVRRASLEDVFLRLTGRTLIE
jgi:lipooligosaccharide transport system ATP-binding protein